MAEHGVNTLPYLQREPSVQPALFLLNTFPLLNSVWSKKLHNCLHFARDVFLQIIIFLLWWKGTYFLQTLQVLFLHVRNSFVLFGQCGRTCACLSCEYSVFHKLLALNPVVLGLVFPRRQNETPAPADPMCAECRFHLMSGCCEWKSRIIRNHPSKSQGTWVSSPEFLITSNLSQDLQQRQLSSQEPNDLPSLRPQIDGPEPCTQTQAEENFWDELK